MKSPPDLRQAFFKERLNRFAARVEVDGTEAVAHVPNSGRLHELFVPDAQVYVSPASSPHRKTAFDLRLVRIDNVLVSCDARLPPSLVAEAHALGNLPQFAGYPVIEREVTFEESRLDLRLSGPGGRLYAETKSVTLVCNGTALFPDAPTIRGAKHLRTLMKAVESGPPGSGHLRHPEARRPTLHPLQVRRPGLRRHAGSSRRKWALDVYAYGCDVTVEEINLGALVPVNLA